MIEQTELLLRTEFFVSWKAATPKQLHYALSKAIMSEIHSCWRESQGWLAGKKRAYYFSVEFLMGRAIFDNLYRLGVLEGGYGMRFPKRASIYPC